MDNGTLCWYQCAVGLSREGYTSPGPTRQARYEQWRRYFNTVTEPYVTDTRLHVIRWRATVDLRKSDIGYMESWRIHSYMCEQEVR